MLTKTSLFSILLVCLALFSLSFKKKPRPADFAGFWVVEGATNNRGYDIKVFEKSGEFYNLSLKNGESIITHKGKFKILDESNYKEKVTELRFNAAYDLLNKEFINHYELSSNKQRLVLSGTVVSKNGRDTLRWSEVYKKVNIPGK